MKTALKTVGLMVLVTLSSGLNLSAQDEMTLEQALKIGLENNFSIQIARNNARVADNNSGKGTAALLPTLNASGSIGKTDSDVETNSTLSLGSSETESKAAQLTLDWTLFDGFSMFAEKKRYRQLEQVGRQQARSLIEANLVVISRAYFTLVAQEQLLDVARSSVEISEVRLEKERIRREIGGASSTDLLNAQVAYNADQSNLLDRELATVVARQDLNLSLGREADTPVKVTQTLNLPELAEPLPDLNRQAMAKNANLMVAQAQKRVAEATLATNRSRFMPKVSLNGNYAWSDRDQMPDDPTRTDVNTETTETTVGLNLVWNLFNGGRDRIDWQNAKVDLKNQQLALRQVRQQLAGDLTAQFETYTRRRTLVGLESQNVEAASRNLEILTDRYEMGSVTSLEFRDAQVSLNRARTNLITAQHQTRLAHLEIQKITGSLSIE